MSIKLTGQTKSPQPVQAPHETPNQTAVSVLLTDNNEAARWRFDFYTTGVDGGRGYVASLVSAAVGSGHKSRLIGTVVQLGCQGWVVNAYPLEGTSRDAVATAALVFGHGTVPGTFPNGPLATVAYV